MKKSILFRPLIITAVLLHLFCAFKTSAQNCGKFYIRTDNSGLLYERDFSPTTTTSLTSFSVTPGSVSNNSGFIENVGLGPAFSYTMPNPGFWGILGANNVKTICYNNGSTWIPTTFTVPQTGSAPVYLAGSPNYIYLYHWAYGKVYRFNGTSAPVVVLTTTPNTNYLPIAADDKDNFYLVEALALKAYNSNGNFICSTPILGLNTTGAVAGSAMAISGNTVILGDVLDSLQYGINNGNFISFTKIPKGYPNYVRSFSSCFKQTVFTATISSTKDSLNCNQTASMTVTSPIASASYSWSGPGIVGSNTLITITVNKPGVYTVSVIDANCIPNTASATFTLHNGGNFFNAAVINTVGPLTCTNSTITLAASPVGPNLQYQWVGPNLPFNAPTQTVSVYQAANYYLNVTNTLTGCSDALFYNLSSIIQPPSLTVASTSSVRCVPQAPVGFTVTGADTYTWLPSADFSAVNASITTASTTATTIYTVLAQLGVCFNSSTISITAVPVPTLNTALSRSVCIGGLTTYTASGASTYTWLPMSVSGPSMAAITSSATNYTLVGANGQCTSAVQITVSLDQPSVSISTSTNLICVPYGNSNVTLTATGAQTYTWIAPITTSTQNPWVTAFNTPISYSVIGRSVNSCTAFTSIILQPTYVSGFLDTYLVPTADTWTLNQVTGCRSATTSAFTLSLNLNSAAAGQTYTWFPGGFTTQTISAALTQPTTYTVAFSALGGCTYSITKTFSAVPVTTVSIINNGPICQGNVASFSISTNAGTVTSAILTNTFAGTVVNYSNTLNSFVLTTSLNLSGCKTTTTMPITVIPASQLTVSSVPNIFCSGKTATFVASGYNSYTWQPGNNTSPISSYTLNPGGLYYTLTVSSGNCVRSYSFFQLVTPTPTLSISSPTAICSHTPITLLASGAASYTWLPNAYGPSVTTIVNNPSTVTLTGSNFGCDATETIALNPIQTPTVSLTASTASICSGDSALINVNSTSSFTWASINSSANPLSVSPATSTTYTVNAVNGQVCAVTKTIAITVYPTPTLQVTFPNDTVCGQTVFTVSATGAQNYNWLPNSSTSNSFTATGNTSVVYTVTGVDGLCVSSKTLQIKIKPKPIVYVSGPNEICAGEYAEYFANGPSSIVFLPSGVMSPSISVTPSNNFTLSVYGFDNLNCFSDTVFYTVNVDPCTSLAEQIKRAKITILPNPFSHELLISTDEEDVELELMNIEGKVLVKQTLEKGATKIATGHLAKGIYFVVLSNGQKQRVMSKLVKID